MMSSHRRCVIGFSLWIFLPFSVCYEIKLLPIGVEVYGVDLKEDLSQQIIQDIKNVVNQHSIVIFKNQGVVPAKRQREISEWFGELALPPMDPHPKTEYPGVYRISNDPKHGYLGIGNGSWHIDGSWYKRPYSITIYHIIKAPRKGNTVFASLTKMLEDVPSGLRNEWDTLYVSLNVLKADSDRSACPSSSPPHPLLYRHPLTGKEVLCLNTSLIKTFGRNLGTADESWTDVEETKRIIRDMIDQLEKDDGKFIYSHKWNEGDLIIVDNLAMVHMASAESQLPPSEVGLRILHRTAVKGKYKPRKNPEGRNERKDEL